MSGLTLDRDDALLARCLALREGAAVVTVEILRSMLRQEDLLRELVAQRFSRSSTRKR